MQNETESMILECSVDGLVLTVVLDELQWNWQNAKTAFLMIVPEALKLYGGDKAINRVGIVDIFSYGPEAAGKLSTEALTTCRDLGEPKDLALRVSFRTPTEAGITSGSVEEGGTR